MHVRAFVRQLFSGSPLHVPGDRWIVPKIFVPPDVPARERGKRDASQGVVVVRRGLTPHSVECSQDHTKVRLTLTRGDLASFMIRCRSSGMSAAFRCVSFLGHPTHHSPSHSPRPQPPSPKIRSHGVPSAAPVLKIESRSPKTSGSSENCGCCRGRA